MQVLEKKTAQKYEQDVRRLEQEMLLERIHQQRLEEERRMERKKQEEILRQNKMKEDVRMRSRFPPKEYVYLCPNAASPVSLCASRTSNSSFSLSRHASANRSTNRSWRRIMLSSRRGRRKKDRKLLKVSESIHCDPHLPIGGRFEPDEWAPAKSDLSLRIQSKMKFFTDTSKAEMDAKMKEEEDRCLKYQTVSNAPGHSSRGTASVPPSDRDCLHIFSLLSPLPGL